MTTNNAQPIRLSFDNADLQNQVRRISEYKGRLDAALVAIKDDLATSDQIAWLEQEGFTREEPSGTGVEPNTFARWIFGPFAQWKNYTSSELMIFPGHIALGWNRRQYKPVTHAEALSIKSELDVRTVNKVDGHVRWLHPAPVIVAGEGKHRVDLFRTHGLDMLANVGITPIPLATELELWRIFGVDGVWALRCLNKDFLHTHRGEIGEFAALPLPELSIPFFKAYGVRERSLRCFPWQVSLGLKWPNRFVSFQPKRWRSLILNDGYI
jgi:hypothetical protein